MKKLLLFVAALLFVANAFSIVKVTFTVPDATVTPNVYAVGDFQGWSPADGVLCTPTANANEFTVDLEWLVTGSGPLQYKFVCSTIGWSYVEKMADGTTEVANRTANDGDVITGIVVEAWAATPTALPSISADKTSVVVSGSSVKVSGEGSSVEIVSISGVSVQVAQLEGEFVSNPLSAGVYIVKVDGTATKVLVK